MLVLSIIAENSIQLMPDGTLLVHIALILLMIALLNATLFKPINRILAEREERTRGRSGESQGILRSVDERLAEYERSLREARAEGYRLLEQQRAVAMAERQNKLSATRAQIESLTVQEKESLRSQTETARAQLGEDARRAANEIAARFVRI
jgi:F-type H+-transporting ATPase subunit b